MAKEKDQIDSGIRSIFSYPAIYKMFQRLIGSDIAFGKLVDIIKTSPHSRILDIGCGEGHILDFLPETINYTGYDLSAAYIEYAKQKYGHRAIFINERVSGMTLKDTQPFDIVLAIGLVHHLNDEEARELYKTGYNSLKRGGTMFTSDNAYYKGQSFMARYISSKDRGQHVRYPDQYQALAFSAFEKVEVIIRHDMIRLPQTTCILKCSKN
jgi:cyclopropane fatty-acyl-phospholipid synthase-like methyltransferase